MLSRHITLLEDIKKNDPAFSRYICDTITLLINNKHQQRNDHRKPDYLGDVDAGNSDKKKFRYRKRS